MAPKKRTGHYVPYTERTSPEASPSTQPTDLRSEGSWRSPAPQPSTFSSWTPALAPIVGSPSIPQPEPFPTPDPEQQEEVERERYEREPEPEPSVLAPPADVELGIQNDKVGGMEEIQPRRTRGFVGGFLAELKKFPGFMVKNNPRGSDIAADGAGPSPRLSYYSSASPSVHGSPLPSQMSQPPFRPATVPIEELYESEGSESSSRASQSQMPYDEQTRNEHYDGTTAVHEPMYDPAYAPTDPSVMSSPVQVGAAEMTDYEKTQTPYPFTNPEDKTLQSYVDRLHRFLTDVYYLPWVSLQVATEYIPADDSSRGRYRRGEPVSWYSPKRRKERPEVDLMSSPIPYARSTPPMIQTIPPTPTLSGLYTGSQYTRSINPSEGRLTLTASQYTYAPTHTHRSRSRGPSESGVTAFRELRSPGQATTVSGAYPSPGASSHGLGHHSMSESFHYASPPRNLQPYPSVASALSSPAQARVNPDYFSPKY